MDEVFIGFIVGFIVGSSACLIAVGSDNSRTIEIFKEEAIQSGAAHYNSTSGQFEWKKPEKVENGQTP